MLLDGLLRTGVPATPAEAGYSLLGMAGFSVGAQTEAEVGYSLFALAGFLIGGKLVSPVAGARPTWWGWSRGR